MNQLHTSDDFVREIRARYPKTATNYGLAKALGVTAQAIDSRESKGTGFRDETGERIAELLPHYPLEYILSCLDAERAKRPNLKAARVRIALMFGRHIKKAAKVAMLLLGLGIVALSGVGGDELNALLVGFTSAAFNGPHIIPMLVLAGVAALIALAGLPGGFRRTFRAHRDRGYSNPDGRAVILRRMENATARMRAFCAAILLPFLPALTHADDSDRWALQINGASVHLETEGYNENNEGVGLQYTDYTADKFTRYAAGTLVNSMYERSWYAGASYGIRAARWIEAAAFIGAVTYPSSRHSVVPVILPVVSVGGERVAIHTTYLPAVARKDTEAIFFQLTVSF